MNTSLESIINVANYLSFFGFLIATILMGIVVSKFGKSTLASIFSYIFVGTAIFVAISVFLNLGAEHFGIADNSLDIWWHILFYMAFIFYFYGLKLLVGLGSADTDPNAVISSSGAKKWSVLALAVIIFVFVAPHSLEGPVHVYTEGSLAVLNNFGLHHFIAFALAGVVASYLFSAKKKLGQIGLAIANPIIIAVSALSLQHFWELLNESWKWVDVSNTPGVGEGVEKIFLIIASLSIIWGALRLKKFTTTV